MGNGNFADDSGALTRYGSITKAEPKGKVVVHDAEIVYVNDRPLVPDKPAVRTEVSLPQIPQNNHYHQTNIYWYQPTIERSKDEQPKQILGPINEHAQNWFVLFIALLFLLFGVTALTMNWDNNNLTRQLYNHEQNLPSTTRSREL